MATTGYEKVANFMAKHAEVATFQRFDFLNMLNILYLQAELVHLENDLRQSMKDDLESGNQIAIDSPQNHDGIEFVSPETEDTQESDEKVVKDGIYRKATITSRQALANDRIEGVKDWWYLSNSRHGQTWELMLIIRKKLKEYNEAVLQQTEMKACHSPTNEDLKFLRRWFSDEKMGNFPLIGRDYDLWETSKAADLVAVKARRADDPLGRLFLNKIFAWWHHCIGYRFKKPMDEESQYFEYADQAILKVADIIGSIISSSLLVGSIFTLYFVHDTVARLGIIAALTQIFSLVLILVTNARKSEVFAATAAFVAVQLVFVGST